MANNVNIKINGVISNAERLVEHIKCSDAEHVKSLVAEAKNQVRNMGEQESLIKLISGLEISDKTYKKILEINPQRLIDAIEQGFVASSRLIPKVDKNGLLIHVPMWFCADAKNIREALADGKSALAAENMQLTKDGVLMVINAYDLERNKISIRKDAVKQIIKAQKIVVQEGIDEKLKVKGTKAVNIYDLGRKLIPADKAVQQVATFIPTPDKLIN